MGLAVAFIMGLAATSLVQSLVNDIIMPTVTVFIPTGEWKNAALAIGTPLGFILIKWGSFLAQLINFIILAFCIFMVIKAMNTLKKKKEQAPAAPPAPPQDVVLLTEIRDLLKR